MVVSKDAKRKRKELSAQQQHLVNAAAESSPEMPKRPKVQAQRKFAQGQSAPQSSYNTLVASSSSNTGPSTSSESREPPTEILPNQRPKTEDFLTFLCFRGTPALPSHLDFLNQSKSVSVEKLQRKKTARSAIRKPGRKTKKGRQSKTVKQTTDDKLFSEDRNLSENKIIAHEQKNKELKNVSYIYKTVEKRNDKDEIESPSFPVRKRAEVIADGIRRSNRKCKRGTKITPDHVINDGVGEGDNFSIIDEQSRVANSDDVKEFKIYNASVKPDTKLENTLKCNENTGKLRKGKFVINSRKNYKLSNKIAVRSEKKDKLISKRSRQKESPIFIPLPETSGRMTRQRAFFEPVKVTGNCETINDNNNFIDFHMKSQNDIGYKYTESSNVKKGDIYCKNEEIRNSISSKEVTKEYTKDKNNLNVFDFSSDDEQPLAKTIKLKKNGHTKMNLKKSSQRVCHKFASKKVIKDNKNNSYNVKSIETSNVQDETIVDVQKVQRRDEKDKKNDQMIIDENFKGKTKRVGTIANAGGKYTKRKNIEISDDVGKVFTSSLSKRLVKQAGKKIKSDNCCSNNDTTDELNNSPARIQRPSRKTKEAATIYMGIIGHRLQLGDDEDDDISLTSFDRPNVRQMEKMESELKRNVSTLAKRNHTSPISMPIKLVDETSVQVTLMENIEKYTTGRRGRPPKHQKFLPHFPIKREIEGMLVKKGVIAKMVHSIEDVIDTKSTKIVPAECGAEEDEDYLLNKELNETKRKLEKSFSDSDDEPLAIKANVKTNEKDISNITDNEIPLVTNSVLSIGITPINILPLANTPISTVTTLPSSTNTFIVTTLPSGANGNEVALVAPSNVLPPISVASISLPLKSNEKKSPVSNSKISSIPVAYGIPTASHIDNVSSAPNTSFDKTNLYTPQSPGHYHTISSHVRSSSSLPQYSGQTTKSLSSSVPFTSTATFSHHTSTPQLNAQNSMKYQTPPTIYPPPIEAYPSPKINPNFLTPKFDRSAIPRHTILSGNHASFTSPCPIKYDITGTGGTLLKNFSLTQGNVTLNMKTSYTGNIGNNGMTMTSSTVDNQSASDPLKDEIGSILAANLMPSKEESVKIFGIASVSLAQSSGPDNTKCTLGKCGSIHKPVLGPVVPTESYIGDQLSGKERRKAKVNMTHEQIHKWLIECSSNPDEIHDDLDDDFDSDLRPNNYSTTPPPIRDDKESTSFSSSSKTTRDLGKSESAWSAKGPSLKATPVIVTSHNATNHRKDDIKPNESFISPEEETDKNSLLINLVHKTSVLKQSSPRSTDGKSFKSDQKFKDDKIYSREIKQVNISEKEPTLTNSFRQFIHLGNTNNKSFVAEKTFQKKSETLYNATAVINKSNRKKNLIDVAEEENFNITLRDRVLDNDGNINYIARTPKRTPVYQQKQLPKHDIELKDNTNLHPKKTNTTVSGAFSAINEKSIYSFDKDDDDDPNKHITYNRQGSRNTQNNNEQSLPQSTSLSLNSPSKKRIVSNVAEKTNRDLTNSSQNNSVLLTLSPNEKSKLVKVSLDAETVVPIKSIASIPTKSGNKNTQTIVSANDDSDSGNGHTFYIPLQGIGTNTDEGGIQGVAVKLGREGPDGPNQKVIMHATLVTKAQIGINPKSLPESMNVSDIVKNLMNSDKKHSIPTATSTNSASNSLKNVPVGTVQPRFKGEALNQGPSTSAGGLVRVNSNSSLFSGSVKSRNAAVLSSNGHTSVNKKLKDDIAIKMTNNTAFPRHDDPTQMVEAPIFRPSEKEFADPIEFIERITPIAARFGICKIIPPSSFKPECRISDEMRFTAYNQYVHKMLYRWGPSAKELSAIKKYLTTQCIAMNHPPWIGGMEVDLPRLYHTVQELGGLKEVIEKKKWARVAEEMCIPKLAQDRVTKLDDIYCKYLLPYDTLSPAERQKLFDEVEADWAKREARARRNADRFVNTESVSNDEDDMSSENDEEESEEEMDGVSMECIVKGRSMPLSQFYRIARNTMALWFKNTEPIVNEVEAEFWRHVAVRDSHVCVHSGSIDSSGWGFGFPTPGPKGKGSNYSRHPWNLKVLTNNSGSMLRSLGPVMGVTVPTLHVGMLFSACCWYRDPHGLSWIEYLHTGASKLWYGIPDDQSSNFRAALTSLIPTHCQNKTIWLPCDTVMVPPHMLTDRGVSLCRIEQKPGEFIVVFPRAYTSSLATGYVVSESVYFATSSWLDLAKDDFRDIHESCEPAMFSLEQLLFALGYDQRVPSDTLQQILPMLQEVNEKEGAAREQLKAAGVTSTEKVSNEKSGKSKKQQQPPYKSIDSECDLCRANLYISMVRTDEGNIYCLQHALKNLNNGNIQAKKCKLIYAYNVDDIENLIKTLKEKIQKRNTSTSKKQK